MAHRSARQALRERREDVLTRLAALEVVDDADAERESLLRELEEVRASLELITPARPLRMRLRLVRGCDMPWESMVGDARVRHCGACDREVYDLTAMDPDEVEAFVEARQHDLPCMQLHARPDGRYQDGPCVPAQRRTLKRAAFAAASLGLTGVLSALAADSSAEAPLVVETTSRSDFDARAFVEPIPEPCPWPVELADTSTGAGGAMMLVPADPDDLDELEARVWRNPNVLLPALGAGRGSVTLAVDVDTSGEVTATVEHVSPGFEAVGAAAALYASRTRLRTVGPQRSSVRFFHEFR